MDSQHKLLPTRLLRSMYLIENVFWSGNTRGGLVQDKRVPGVRFYVCIGLRKNLRNKLSNWIYWYTYSKSDYLGRMVFPAME